MSYLVKLVRDGIPDLLGGDATVEYGPIDRETHARLLRAKLIEEAAEYVTNPCEEELADVLAVVRALALVDLQTDWHDVRALEVAKYGKRGGFDRGTGMFVRHPHFDDGLPAIASDDEHGPPTGAGG